MVIERSAGFVLFRTLPTGRVYLLLDYGRHWDYAKGHVEPGEDDLAAATRELEEETGIASIGVRPGFAHEIEYVFRGRDKRLIRKTVVFLLAESFESDVRLSHEHVGWEWMHPADALARLTFPSARALLRAADDFLENAG